MFSESDLTPEARQGNRATYCPADNQLRLTCERWPDRETVRHLYRVGFKATPGLDCSFAATWSPAAEDACFALIPDDDDIGDEDDGPGDRAAGRSPTGRELEACRSEQKAAKRRRRKCAPKSPPLLNPTDEDAEKLQAAWNRARGAQGFRPTEVVRLTSARYSALAKGTCTPFGVISVDPKGKKVRRHDRSLQGQLPPLFRIRKMAGPGRFIGRADAVVVLTDEPRKPLPLDWAAVDSAARSGATA